MFLCPRKPSNRYDNGNWSPPDGKNREHGTNGRRLGHPEQSKAIRGYGLLQDMPNPCTGWCTWAASHETKR